MVHAMQMLLDADLFNSMFHKVAIISYVIVRILQMPHSAMVPTENWLNTITNPIEDFMKSGVWLFTTLDLFICTGTGTHDTVSIQ